MNKIILALLISVPTLSFGQSFGCFVPFESGSCEVLPYARCVNDVDTTYNAFGASIANICVEVFNCRKIVSDADVEISSIKKRNDSLIKKLRKACGSKCKRIK